VKRFFGRRRQREEGRGRRDKSFCANKILDWVVLKY
jgi:hypothetical protein